VRGHRSAAASSAFTIILDVMCSNLPFDKTVDMGVSSVDPGYPQILLTTATHA
jgi:hypothetical protein